MATWIALLRGINVGGNHLLPMAELRRTLTALGLLNVATHLQSGNVVFESPKRSATKLQDELASAIEATHGFPVPVLVLPARDLTAALQANPFPDAAQPSSLLFYFLWAKAIDPDLDACTQLAAPTEEFQLHGRLFYLHAPDGIGRSKLAAQVERKLGVPTTARNLRTVTKLAELAGEKGD